MSNRNSLSVPTSPQLHELVRDKLNAIEGLSINNIGVIAVGDLLRQNAHSSRLGGEIRIELTRRGQSEIRLWVKRVESPQAAFCRMRAAYDRAAEHGVADPIPKPYFFDQDWGLVFMQRADGTPLRSMVFHHAIVPRPARHVELCKTIHNIGHWLCRYQKAVKSDVAYDIAPLIAQIESHMERDNSLRNEDKLCIGRHLKEIERSLHQDRIVLDGVWPHNDFTLRNILVGNDETFTVLDWDAMVHPRFSHCTNGAWDVALFLLNLHSLERFRPIARRSTLQDLAQNFLSGYLDAMATNGAGCSNTTMNALIYVFVLRFWYGIDADGPLREIYRRNFGWRFCRALKQRLVLGPSQLLSA
jgi:hypothetical protein